MNKTELIAAVAEKTGCSRKVTGEILENILSTITDELSSNGRVQFVGFGTFEVKHKPARQVVNPKTHMIMDVPATDVPRFHAGAALKDKVKGVMITDKK